MFPTKAVCWGLLLAPLPVWAVVGVFGFFEDLNIPNWSWKDALVHELFVFPYYVVGSYLISFVIALPLYTLGWRYFRVSLISCLLCGALIGGVPSLGLTALQYIGIWPTWESESWGGTPLIIGHRFTTEGLIHYTMTDVAVAAFGAVIAAMFWWFAVRRNPAAQSYQIARSLAEKI
jgi:hypothetical protein